MSEIKRYWPGMGGEMQEQRDGEFVAYDDYEKLRRSATDSLYMMEAYRAMLGPIALKVVKGWEDKGVLRQHTYWGPESQKLTGEERAQGLLDVESAIRPADSQDAISPPVRVEGETQ